MGAPRFSLTEKQIRDLIAVTPPGYVPKITLSFEKDESDDAQREPEKTNPADLIEP